LRELVIFDLDETLVHATESALSRPSDFRCAAYFVYVRPHLSEMLASVANTFDLAVWSSSSRSYVNQVVAQVIPSSLSLKFAWSIDQCVQRVDPPSGGYVYIKDLRKVQRFGYPVERITIVDDSAEKVARQPRNHLKVSPFEGDANDVELLTLATRLLNRRTGQTR
jgi:carboxy-terminal domain RNA polymerase II polypeptide A small phosphatase